MGAGSGCVVGGAAGENPTGAGEETVVEIAGAVVSTADGGCSMHAKRFLTLYFVRSR